MNKEILNELEEFKSTDDDSYTNYNTNSFMNIIYNNNLENYTEDIVDEEGMNNYLKNQLDSYGWVPIKNMLSDINDTSEDYYMIDGYGCFRNVTNGDINGIIESIEYDFNNNMEL